MRVLLVVLIAIALLSAAYFSGPLLVVIILVSTLVYLALRGIYRSMDLNKDGEVNFDDRRHVLTRLARPSRLGIDPVSD